jgi:hypothetical protein
MPQMLKGIWIAVLVIWMQPSFAEQNGGPWEKWSLSLGGFAASLSNDVRIGTPGIGAEFDVEEALGLESSDTVFRVDAAYRFGSSRRHRMDLTWFDLSREATKTLERDINVDGTIYPIGSTANFEKGTALHRRSFK